MSNVVDLRREASARQWGMTRHDLNKCIVAALRQRDAERNASLYQMMRQALEALEIYARAAGAADARAVAEKAIERAASRS